MNVLDLTGTLLSSSELRFASKSVFVEHYKTQQSNEALPTTAAQARVSFSGCVFRASTAFLRVIRSPTTCGEFREAPQDCPRGTAAA